MSKKPFNFYKEFPKTCQPDDFWGQVKRTVNGKPVSQEQIEMIVDAVVNHLNLTKDDMLLDLCCGNGALTNLFLEHCHDGVGVDFSEYLIDVANKNFSRGLSRSYLLADVVDFCQFPPEPRRFNKAVCYGSFSYLENDRAEKMLTYLKENFPNLTRVFIGNYPDKDRIKVFSASREVEPDIENEPDSPIGIWRTQAEFIEMAQKCGWHAEIHKMPESYYAAHYRYDVVLVR